MGDDFRHTIVSRRTSRHGDPFPRSLERVIEIRPENVPRDEKMGKRFRDREEDCEECAGAGARFSRAWG